MSKQRGKLVLSSAEEEQLQQLIRAQSTPQGLAKRARVVQLAAQGMGVRAIGARVGMHHNQVAKRRRRYIRGGLGALQDEPRSGRKGGASARYKNVSLKKGGRGLFLSLDFCWKANPCLALS